MTNHMKLRTKLLLGYSGFILALGLLGAWSARTLSQMSAVSGRIIAENYDSVVAAQDMKESLERQDSAAVFELLGEHDRAARQAAEHRARFDAAFDKAAANITEVGEPEIDRGDPERARRLLPALRRVPAAPRAIARPSTSAILEPRFNAVRADCDRLLHLNQEAMRRKADRRVGTARRWFFITLGLALVLMVVGRGGRVQPVERHRRTRPPADRRDDEGGRRRSGRGRAGAVGRRDRRARRRVQPDGRADPRAAAIGSRQAAHRAADDRSRHRLALRPGDRHRQRGARHAHQRRRRAAVRRAGRHRRQADRARSPATRASRRRSTDVLRSEQAVASESAAEVLPWAVDGSRAGVPRPIDADARRRRSLRRRRHAARGHHAPQRDQPAEVRVHRRRVARAADAADERPDGHSPAARRRGRPARRTPAGDPAGVPRRYGPARSADAAAARSVEDRIGRGGAGPRARASVGPRPGSGRFAASAGRVERAASRRRCAAGPCRRSSPIAIRSSA